MDFDGREINIEYSTLPGHIDGVGSTIHFRVFEDQNSELALQTTAEIIGGIGARGGPPARMGYRGMAQVTW